MMAVIQTPVRIIFIFIKTNTMNVLHISILGYLSLPIVAYILYFLHFRIFLVYEITIHFSLAFVLYLQYLYSLPQLYKMTLTTQNTSKMMTAYAVGEALLPAVIEYLME